jgi:hypothetical protein
MMPNSADHLAPAQAGVGDRDDHGEVVGAAGQQHVHRPFDEALAHREWARPFEAKAEGSAIGS